MKKERETIAKVEVAVETMEGFPVFNTTIAQATLTDYRGGKATFEVSVAINGAAIYLSREGGGRYVVPTATLIEEATRAILEREDGVPAHPEKETI
jgi:hypothetical protein